MAADPGLLLRPLLRARRFDERVVANAADLVRGHFHVSIGLEATAVAFSLARREGDVAVTTYRNHAHLAAAGSDLAAMFTEILGRGGGPQRARSGSTHLCDPDLGILHTSAMVGGGVPHALGMAYARMRTEPGTMVFCFLGDGAFGEGVVHECLNMAALWQLPVLFICENNAAPVPGQANAFQLAVSLGAIAEVHRVPSADVDARHPDRVAAAVDALATEVRDGGGPRFLDARAGSWPGNQTFFPYDATGPTDLLDAGRGVREDQWREIDDPVLHECRRLLVSGVPMAVLQEVDAVVSAEVEAAWEAALAAPAPAPSAAFDDVVGG